MRIIILGRVAPICGAMCLVAAVAACDEAEESVRAPPPVVASDAAVAGVAWLDLTDETRPEVWLASREAGRAMTPDDPAAADYLVLLQDAASRFNETPRMIANRTVQLEAMLGERGIDEDTRRILTGFLAVATKDAARRDYGSMCHHYFNLRSTGVDRPAALAALGSGVPAPP